MSSELLAGIIEEFPDLSILSLAEEASTPLQFLNCTGDPEDSTDHSRPYSFLSAPAYLRCPSLTNFYTIAAGTYLTRQPHLNLLARAPATHLPRKPTIPNLVHLNEVCQQLVEQTKNILPVHSSLDTSLPIWPDNKCTDLSLTFLTAEFPRMQIQPGGMSTLIDLRNTRNARHIPVDSTGYPTIPGINLVRKSCKSVMGECIWTLRPTEQPAPGTMHFYAVIDTSIYVQETYWQNIGYYLATAIADYLGPLAGALDNVLFWLMSHQGYNRRINPSKFTTVYPSVEGGYVAVIESPHLEEYLRRFPEHTLPVDTVWCRGKHNLGRRTLAEYYSILVPKRAVSVYIHNDWKPTIYVRPRRRVGIGLNHRLEYYVRVLPLLTPINLIEKNITTEQSARVASILEILEEDL